MVLYLQWFPVGSWEGKVDTRTNPSVCILCDYCQSPSCMCASLSDVNEGAGAWQLSACRVKAQCYQDLPTQQDLVNVYLFTEHRPLRTRKKINKTKLFVYSTWFQTPETTFICLYCKLLIHINKCAGDEGCFEEAGKCSSDTRTASAAWARAFKRKVFGLGPLFLGP